MKKKCLAVLAVMGLVALGLSGPADASLVVSGTGTMQGVEGSYKLIYDTDLDITWLDYSKSYGNWSTQMSWAENLSVTVGGTTYDNWRLPNSGTSPASGYNDTNSEMGHLYYTELRLGSYPARGDREVIADELNAGVFDNLVVNGYRSGTEYTLYPSNAWTFYTGYGYQSQGSKDNRFLALAVMPGQIQSVPEPASMLLVCSSLAGLVGLKRRKK